MSIQDTIAGWKANRTKQAKCKDENGNDPCEDGVANKTGEPEMKPKQKEEKTTKSMKARPVPKEPIEGIAKQSNWDYIKSALLGATEGAIGVGGTLGLGGTAVGLEPEAIQKLITLGAIGGGIGRAAHRVGETHREKEEGIAKQSNWQKVVAMVKQANDEEEEQIEELENNAAAVKELWFEISGMDKSASFADRIAMTDDAIIHDRIRKYLVEKKASETGWDDKDKELFEKSARTLFQGARNLFRGGAKAATPPPIPTPQPLNLAPRVTGRELGGAPIVSNPAAKLNLATPIPAAAPAAARPFIGTKGALGLGAAGLGAGYFGGRGVGRSQGIDVGYNAAEQYYNQQADNTGILDRIIQVFTGQKFSPEQIGLGRQMMARTPRGELFDRFYKG